MKAIAKRAGYRPRTIELRDRVDTARGLHDGLAELQRLVGGWICTAAKISGEAIPSGHTVVIYCDDEGLLKPNDLNFIRPTDRAHIVGDVVAVAIDDEGDSIAMTDDDARAVVELLLAWSPVTDMEDPS